MGKKLSQVKRYSDEKKWEDDVEWFSFPEDRIVMVRVVGDVEVMARHWIKTMSGKMFPTWCPRLDEEENWQHDRPCPAHSDFEDKAQKVIIANVIIRQMQERGDPNPVKAIMLPHAVNDDLVTIAELHKTDPADEQHGIDLAVKFTPKAVGNKKWSIHGGAVTPMTDEEKRYRYNRFADIIPNFGDEEVAALYAKNMKEAMARHKYYVVPEQRVPQNARDPFKYFRGDARGQPWTEFAVLVDYRNAEKGDDAASYRVSRTGRRARDGEEERIYDEDEGTEGRHTRHSERAAHGRTAESAAREAGAGESFSRNDSDASERGQRALQDDGRANAATGRDGADQSGRDGTLPECYSRYHGGADCTACGVRAKCIDTTDDEDM